MNKVDLAKVLNGREYPLKMDDALLDIVKENNLVIVFGASDDLMEFRGAIYDETDVYNGGFALLTKKGLIRNECDSGDCCPNYIDTYRNAKKIKALWCEDDDFSWTYETDIPHSTFIVMEDGDKYCKGLVFHIDDV